jgi:ABC-type bacteriocin/lantibiotic exporter with double-glycine peptidase domain
LLFGLLKEIRTESRDPVGRSSVGFESFTTAVHQAITMVIGIPVNLFFLVFFMFYLARYDSALVGISVAFFICSSTLKFIVGGPLARLTERELAAQRKFHEHFSAVIQQHGVFRSHGAVEWVTGKLNRSFTDSVRALTSRSLLHQAFGAFHGLLNRGVFFASFYLVHEVWKITGDDAGLSGTFSMMVSITLAILDQLSDSFLTVREMRPVVEAIPPVAVHSAGHLGMTAGGSSDGALYTLRGVSVEIGGRRLLNHVDLDLYARTLVVIRGPNGSGKSTLLRVLGFQTKIGKGELLCRVRAGEVHAIHKGDRVLPGSLREFLDPFGIHEDLILIRMLDLVEMKDWFQGSVLGFKTPLGDGESGLSGGENMRLILAKSLLAGPKVLLLDEATASLDVATELRLIERIRKMPSGPELLVLVSHRSETDRLGDCVLEIRDGVVHVIS